MKNIVLTGLLFLCLHPVQSFGQSNPPPPPPKLPPPSPAYDPTDYKKAEEAKKKAEKEAEEARRRAILLEKKRLEASEKASEGLRFTRITVWGNYQLGMLQQEYDSIAKLEPINIQTDSFTYTVQAQPSFIGKRLSALILLPDGIFHSNLSDINAYFEKKSTDWDKRIIRDTAETFPSILEPSLKGIYPVREYQLEWKFRYYDMTIKSRLVDIKDGTWKGSYIIKYKGNKDFITLLRELELKEK